MNSIVKTLDEIGFQRVTPLEEQQALSKISVIEKKHKIVFPQLYKDIILKYNDSIPDCDFKFKTLDSIPFASGRNFLSLNYFLTTDSEDANLEKFILNYKRRIPDSLIPIAMCEGQNLICLSVSNTHKNNVFFWEHENEFQTIKEDRENVNEYWDNLYLISNSLEEFLLSFEKIQEKNNSNFDFSKVKIKLSPELLSRMPNK